MELQIQFIKVFIYSTVYGSCALLLLLLIRKVTGKIIIPEARMCLWWAAVFTFIFTLIVFPKGNFTNVYIKNGYAIPPIHINFKILGELDKGHLLLRTGDIEYVISAFYNGSQKILHRGNANLMLNIAFFTLLSGMLFYLILNIVRYVKLKKKAESFEECDDQSIKQYVQQDALFYGIQPPVIKKVPGEFLKEVPCTCVIGFLSPVLLIISKQWEILSEEQKSAVITHEIYHIRKKDNVLNVFFILLQALQWFNPVVWIGLKYLRQDLECLRDAQIIKHFTCEKQKAYANAIISIAQMNSKKYRTFMHSGMLCSSGGSCRAWLLQEKNVIRRSLGLLIAIMFILMVLYAVLEKETFALIGTTYGY